MKKLKWPVMLLATVASGVICFLGIPILLNWLFKTPAPAPVLAAEWSAGDALGYVGGTLAFIGAMFLGWNTWKQNRDLQNRQDDSFIAENSCMALIDKVEFKGFSQKCVNFDCHSEAIAVTDISDASVQDYGTFECEILLHPTKKSPVVVRVLNAFLLVGNHPLNFGKYDECYTRMAIGKNGSRFNLTFAEKYGEKFVDNVAFYTKDNVFFLPEISRWSFVMENAKQDDIALKIDTALYTIEKANPALKGALPDNYYSRLHIDTAKLASLLDEIDKINTDDKENDIIGRVYEYFLSKFALAEGKGKGEFYTPKCIVNLIAEMIEPYDGILYDPCCGSGGMFVQSMKFVEAHHGNKKKVSIYGQEYTNTTYKLCKMNLAIRGISANLGEMAANTFTNDQHKDLKADYIMANPPFNQKEWRADNELIDDPRWDGYEVPPTSNANYGWILNIVSKLSQNGVAGITQLKILVSFNQFCR